MKLSFKPNKRTRLREHGFRARMATKGGRGVLARRRSKGRAELTVSESAHKYVGSRISMTATRRVRGTGPANRNRVIATAVVRAPRSTKAATAVKKAA